MIEREFIEAINTLINSETTKLSDEDKSNLIFLRSRIEESISKKKPFSKIDWGNAVDIISRVILIVSELIDKK